MKTFYYTPFFTGVRDYLVEKCMEVIKDGKKAIYILPSREAIFDVRNKFLHLSGNLTGTSVFSFSDLASETGGRRNITEDISLVIIRNILNKKSEGFFKDVKDRTGFIAALYSFIKRLKQLNLSPDSHEYIKYNFTGMVLEKFNFIRSVYEEYETYKEKERLYDLNDIPLLAAKKVKYSPFLFQTGIIVIDGYINIDPVDKALLKNISKYYPDINFYASVPFKNSYNEQFINSEIIKDLKELGFIEGNRTFPEKKSNPSIKSLCEHLYSDTVLKDDLKGMKISNSPCIDHEVRQIASVIKKKILSDSTKAEKIAIYVKNINEYGNAFEEIFKEFNIPHLPSWKKTLIELPLIKDLLGLFNIYIEGREHEGIRNTFSSIYILPCAIKSDFKTDRLPLNRIFTGKDPSGYMDKFSTFIKEYFTDIDLSPFIDIISSLKPSEFKTKEAYLKQFIDVTDRLDVKGNIISLYLEGIINAKQFTEDIKALESLCKIIEEIIDIEKKYNKSEDFTAEQVFEELIDWANIERGKIVKDTGGVRILNPDLARGQYYDIVFIAGVNEGIFPSVLSANPIFDRGEHDLLMSENINLINKKWELEREKIRFNLCMATAEEELYISYRTCDEQGEYMIKSSFLDDLYSLIDEKTLKNVTGQKIYMRNRFEPPEEPQSREEMLRKAIHYIWKDGSCPVDNISEDILDYINHASLMEYTRQKNPVFDFYDGMLSDPSLLKNKYYFTPSRFNSYSSCPFKYFMERILAISIDEDDEPDARIIGTFYHEILKYYYKDNSNSYDENRLAKIFNRIFDDTLKKLYHNIMAEKLWQFIKKELFDVISRFIISDIKNLDYYHEKTGFTMKPCLLEHPFIIKDDYKMIRGVVDRVDMEIDEHNCFTGRFIIYDYKNSSVKDIKDSVEGRDFQLPVYYLAIEEQLNAEFPDKNCECLALLYYSIKQNKKSGIVRSDVKKNIFNRGGPRYTVGRENMIVLMDYISEKTSELIDHIKNGVFTLPCPCPLENSKYPCNYRKICRYDRYRISEKEGN